MRKFDFVIGNPPYQETTEGTSDKSVYNYFMDEAYKISDKVELITPGKFLFDAGKTPTEWNHKMLNDEHLKVLYYEHDSSKVFSNTDVKGGIAITFHDNTKKFGAIGAFTHFPELNSILSKVFSRKDFSSLTKIIYLQVKFNLNAVYADHPEYRSIIGSGGNEKRLTTSIFGQLDFFNDERTEEDDLEIIGLINNKRVSKYISKKYILDHENLMCYKVIVPKSNGSGALGEVLSSPLIGSPSIGHTQSFISIGAFPDLQSAENTMKYTKSKFFRCMLGVLKITQDNPPEKWKFVPLQDFTEKSDIDWSKSISEIDQQLYKKYNLTQEEIDFIETHVKEMA